MTGRAPLSHSNHCSILIVPRALFLLLILLLAAPAVAQPVPFDRAYSAGLSLLQQGDAEAALPHLRMALDADSLQPAVYPALAAALLQTGQTARAESIARRGLDRFDDQTHLRQLYAEALLQQDRFEDALNEYEKVADAMGRGESVPGITLASLRERLGELYQIVGSRAFESGRYDEARRHYRMAAEYSPAEPTVHRNLAYLHLQQGNAEAVLEAAEEGLRRFSDDAELLRLKGTALAQLERYEEAAPVYRRVYEASPHDVDLGLAYAQVLLMAQQRIAALEHFEELLQRHPRERRIYEALIELNRRAFNLQGALAVLQRLREQFPEDADVLRRIAQTHELVEDYDDAAAVYDTLAAMPEAAESAAQARARLFVRQDSLHAALKVYREQLARHPTDTALLESLADLHVRLEAWDDALDAYRRLEDARGTPDPRTGFVLEQLGREDAAAQAYRAAIKDGTGHALPYYRLSVLMGRGAIASNQENDACDLAADGLGRALAQVQALQNEMADRLRSQGIGEMTALPATEAELERQKQLAEDLFDQLAGTCPPGRSAAVLAEMLDQYPESPRLQYLVGRYYLGRGDREQARRHLRQAVDAAPALLEAHLALGELHAEEDKWRDAILAYERVLSLDEQHEEAYRALIRLHQRAGRLDALIQRWQARYRTASGNAVLREHLIEALHKAGRTDEARELVEDARDG